MYIIIYFNVCLNKRLIRNSWGSSWGNNGTIKIERKKAVCYLETTSAYGLEYLGFV